MFLENLKTIFSLINTDLICSHKHSEIAFYLIYLNIIILYSKVIYNKF